MSDGASPALSPGRTYVVVATTGCLFIALMPSGPLGIWPGTALAAVVALAGSWITARADLGSLLEPTRSDVLWGIGLGVVMALATHLVYLPTVLLAPVVAEQVRSLYGLFNSPPGRIAALPIVLLVVVAEELVWRGILYGWLRTRMGRAAAVVLATAAYVLPQLGSGSWVLPAAALGCGAVWTAQRAVFGNLTVPLLTHLTWDLLIMVLVPLEARGYR